MDAQNQLIFEWKRCVWARVSKTGVKYNLALSAVFSYYWPRVHPPTLCAMQRYSINAQQVTWEFTDGEAVIVHFESSAYYGLNGSGTYIWCRLTDGSVEMDELAQTLAARYGKSPAEIAADLEGFLGSLKTEDLITESAAAGSDSARPAEASVHDGYEPPRLTKFGELEKLILSGE